MSPFHATRLIVFRASLCAALLSTGLLVGCGGASGNASIGGTVNNLMAGSSVTLQNNNADNLTISQNQGFTFPTSVASGGSYNVTVLTQPAGETCAVANGAGTVDSQGDDVTNVAVSCSLSSSVGGTVSGLAVGSSVGLTSNGLQLGIASNGLFAFPGLLPAGTAYDVTVSYQPTGQTCSIANGSGVVTAGVMASVAVTCQ